MAATLADITSFETQLLTAESTQTGAKGNTEHHSVEVDQVITTAMVALYGILGECITHFKEDATQADFVFDLDTLRNHQQVVFTAGLHTSEHETLMEHSFSDADTIAVDNDGKADIGIYLAAKNGDAQDGYTLITLKAGEFRNINITEFTGNTGNRFLSVVNLSTLVEGHVEVEIA